MSKIYIFVVLTAVFFARAVVLEAETADRILAVVNKHVITQVDMRNYLEGLRFRLSQQYRGSQLDKVYKEEAKSALADLIGDILIVEEAEKEKIDIPQEMVETRFLQFRKSFSSPDEFDAYLRQTGTSISDIKKKIKRQLLIREFINRKVRPTIEIKPSEITNYYRTHQEQFRHPEEIEYESLKFESKVSAENALAEIKKEGFAKARQDYPQQFLSGSINMRQCRSELLPLFSLKEGDCSDIIEVGDSYFIFYVKKVRPERLISLKEAQTTIWGIIYQDKFAHKLDGLIEELKKKAVIKIYARENSNN
ncbi:MAG: peptidyl-prolyl cis-trans isomerase [Candidatus Omnitrophica bacterium]|nr:peptidyl-prolyl cis-trans isomerase [Candidatus Omnitrophota bacterium]